MRFELNFMLAIPEINTIDYRRVFTSLIKSALNGYNDGKLMDRYYNGTVGKDFSWTVLMERPQFQKDKIILEGNRVKMIMSTGDENGTGYHLFSAFMAIKNKEMPLPSGNCITLINLRQLNQKVITSNSCIFKTMTGSPLVVREHNKENNRDKYYTNNDAYFDEKLTIALKNQAEKAGFKADMIDTIRAKAINMKKSVVFNYGIYLDANNGYLEIKGEPILLQHFYQCGICSKHSMSFGMVDLAMQKDN